MKRDRRFRDWRVAGAIGLVGGFLVGLLIFGSPWHLPPDWGDIPTWLLVVLAAVAGWIGLGQLRLLRQQLADEAERNVKRDELLGTQLAEAEARALSDRRRQAEGIDVGLALQGRPPVLKARVVNNSRRPVTEITCRIMSRTTRGTLVTPDESGEMFIIGEPGSETEFVPSTVPAIIYDTLRPGARCSFLFNGLGVVEPDHVLVAWFTDDAGFRWQLDEYLHLVQAGDGDEYVP